MTISSKTFRYDTSGKWYKGNTHIHTIASDGGKSISEITSLYADAGYDFLFATDHGVASDVGNSSIQSPLLWLDGIEIDGLDNTGAEYHAVCLGKTEGITREMTFVQALESAREQSAILVLAHPYWSGNTLEDACRWQFHGVEVYNYAAHWLNGKSDGGAHWNAMLKLNPDLLAFSVDDAHLRPEYPGWNGGWIVTNVTEFSQKAILTAIRRGNFFSSCGPEFKTIDFDGENINMTVSPVQFIRLVGPASLGQRMGSFDGKLLTQASMKIPAEWDYVYIEIEDRNGHRAWSNTLFMTGHRSTEIKRTLK